MSTGLLLPVHAAPNKCYRRLDRYSWSAGAAIRAYGMGLGLRSTSTEALETLLSYLPPIWRISPKPEVDVVFSWVEGRESSARRYVQLYEDGMLICKTTDRQKALRLLDCHLPLAVAALSRAFTFLHAGVVGWQGRAILLPGRSFSGKSRLVHALVQRGATYYSDEFALLDKQGMVHPYPVSLGLRGEDNEKRLLSPKSEHWSVGNTPLLPGLVFLGQYEARSSSRLRTLSGGQAVLALLDQCVQARIRSAVCLDAMSKIVQNAAVLTGTRGEAEAMADRLLSLATTMTEKVEHVASE